MIKPGWYLITIYANVIPNSFHMQVGNHYFCKLCRELNLKVEQKIKYRSRRKPEQW